MKLRFNFSHKAQIALPELSKIESMSIDWIKKNVKVYSKNLDMQTAQKIPGLRAVFGKSYPDTVRVVTLEYDADKIAKDIENPKWRGTSIEFCGRTRVSFPSFFREILLTETLSIDNYLVMFQELGTSRTLSSQKSRVLWKVFDTSLLLPDMKHRASPVSRNLLKQNSINSWRPLETKRVWVWRLLAWYDFSFSLQYWYSRFHVHRSLGRPTFLWSKKQSSKTAWQLPARLSTSRSRRKKWWSTKKWIAWILACFLNAYLISLRLGYQ